MNSMPIGTIFLFVGILPPQGWLESKGTIECSKVEKLCEALKPYYVKDNILTFPDCSDMIEKAKFGMTNYEQIKNLKCIIAVE